AAAEAIFGFRATSDGQQPCSAFVINPTTRALKIFAHLRSKSDRALRRDAYFFALCAYFCLPGI
ncbi:MAG: hypothetical protein WAV27_01575, partial [Xanthobacteraceae bacterium]